MDYVKNWFSNGSVLVRCTMMGTVLLYGISHEGISFLSGKENELSVRFVVVDDPVDIIALPAFLSIVDISGIPMLKRTELFDLLKEFDDHSGNFLFICSPQEFIEMAENLPGACFNLSSLYDFCRIKEIVALSSERSKKSMESLKPCPTGGRIND